MTPGDAVSATPLTTLRAGERALGGSRGLWGAKSAAAVVDPKALALMGPARWGRGGIEAILCSSLCFRDGDTHDDDGESITDTDVLPSTPPRMGPRRRIPLDPEPAPDAGAEGGGAPNDMAWASGSAEEEDEEGLARGEGAGEWAGRGAGE